MDFDLNAFYIGMFKLFLIFVPILVVWGVFKKIIER